MLIGSFIYQPFSPTTGASGHGRLGSANSPLFIIRRNGVESKAKFFIIQKTTGHIIYRGISNPDGTWEVTGLNPNQYFQIVTYDETGTLNAATADWVKPVVP